MIFSIYDYETKRFRYYEGAGRSPATAWFRGPQGPRIPEALAVMVPSDASYVGTGKLPRGVIATAEPGVGSPDAAGNASSPPESRFNKFLLVLAGVLAGVSIGRRLR